jgi:hypothetical protein
MMVRRLDAASFGRIEQANGKPEPKVNSLFGGDQVKPIA